MRDAIDLAVFRELQDTAGAEFVAELVDTFLAEAPAMLAELRAARAATDGERFRRAAHSLKSNSASLGALTLSAMAKDLEMMGKAGTLGGVAAKLAAADVEYARVSTALEARRPK